MYEYGNVVMDFCFDSAFFVAFSLVMGSLAKMSTARSSVDHVLTKALMNDD